MERRLELSLLLDFYGPLLTKRCLDVTRLYCDEDLSLQEIADQLGITRQGAHDAIKRAETQLARYEAALNLANRYGLIRQEVAACRAHLRHVEATESSRPALQAAVRALDAMEWIER